MIDDTKNAHVSVIDQAEKNPLKQSLSCFDIEGEDELFKQLVELCKKQRLLTG